ncbi:MAG TPA: bifunctional 3-(3-hydroxy-phenyl)propionate/3-hydroxycinnamic acid hydroxylase [Burkholderiales bacterium]|jgi:3-(3-hydroxy-phenyl)propionate hydroxylase
MSSTQKIHDVAVVGFGPSGAVAAGLLGGYGLSTYVCDRSREVYDKPRAIALDHEILRVFQQLGVVERIAPYMEPFTDSCYYGVDGQLIRRMSTVAPPYPLGYVPSIVFSQPPVEDILRAHAQGLPQVRVELGVAVTSLTQDEEGVTLTTVSDDGTTQQVRARYVIGADGASSTVRQLAGLELEDLGFDQPWLVVDVKVNEAGLRKLPRESVQYCEPQRPSSFIIGPGNHRRWEISINQGEDPKHIATPEETWKLLSRWITPDDATLWRQASYRFHALVATQWRAGRVFVAGDAAHQQPPFLGQGMCQGVRDATNLAWKLAAVLQGLAGDALLDTYGIERKGHVTALTTRIKQIGRMIGERDIAAARTRDAHALEECGGTVKPMPRQDVQPALAAGLLGEAAHAARGTLFPQPWLASGANTLRMDQLAGTGWRLVTDGSLAAPPADELPPACMVLPLGAPYSETEGVLAAWFARHQCRAALVRPDHYVYGVASNEAQLRALLAPLKNTYQRGD